MVLFHPITLLIHFEICFNYVECQFPFTYDGEVFNTCTRKNSQNGKPWCATATNKNTGEVIRGNWGDCDKSCIASGRWPEEQATDQISIANVTQLTPNQMYNSASRYLNVIFRYR